MKRRTLNDFINEANKIHNNKYDYSEVCYVNQTTKVKIICPIHGEFWQIPKNHLKGRGCCKCGHERTNASKVLSNDEFIRRANIKHKNKYTYEKTKYSRFDSDIVVTCPIHGDFHVNSHYHISNGIGCPECAKINMGPPRLTTKEFVKKAKQLHGDLYDYSKVNYVLSSKKVEIICPKHGSFWMTPNKHLIGECCPRCAETKGERLVSKILTLANYDFKSQYNINVISEIRNKLRIDFAVIHENNIYLIEYHGQQHYYPVEYFGGMQKFIEQQNRDNLLRTFVLENPNYQLLEIDYRWNYKTIKSKLLKFLKNVPTNSNVCSKLGELLENPEEDNQQPNQGLTTLEGSETNGWNCNAEYNIDTSTQYPEMDNDIVRAI